MLYPLNECYQFEVLVKKLSKNSSMHFCISRKKRIAVRFGMHQFYSAKKLNYTLYETAIFNIIHFRFRVFGL